MEPVTSVAIVQPRISLWGSFSVSLGSWFSFGLPLAIVAEVVAVVSSISQVMSIAVAMIAQTSIAQTVPVIAVAVGMSGIAESVIVKPWVSLWVSLSISLSSGLGLSILYGLDSLFLSGGGGGDGRDQTVGKDSVSAGDGDTLIVLAANRGCVDEGVVDGV